MRFRGFRFYWRGCRGQQGAEVVWKNSIVCTAQKMKFSVKDFFSKCDQILRKLQIWSHLLKKSLIENFIFCAVLDAAKRTLFTYSINSQRVDVSYVLVLPSEFQIKSAQLCREVQPPVICQPQPCLYTTVVDRLHCKI